MAWAVIGRNPPHGPPPRFCAQRAEPQFFRAEKSRMYDKTGFPPSREWQLVMPSSLLREWQKMSVLFTVPTSLCPVRFFKWAWAGSRRNPLLGLTAAMAVHETALRFLTMSKIESAKISSNSNSLNKFSKHLIVINHRAFVNYEFLIFNFVFFIFIFLNHREHREHRGCL